MEKRSIALRSVFFVLIAAIVSICMFMNWFPVEINLGAVHLDDVFGTVNALTLSGTVSKIEDMLGSLAGFLPEAFEAFKVKSTILTVCAYATIASYVCVSALHILKKNKFAELGSLVSAVLAIITSVVFSNMIKDIYIFTDSPAAGNVAHNIVMRSPCLVVLLGGIVSAVCTDLIGDWIVVLLVGLIESIVATVLKIGYTIVDFVKTIIANIGFVLSDFAGAILGILAGVGVMGMTDSVWLSVIAGLGVAGLTAGACLVIVTKLFYSKR